MVTGTARKEGEHLGTRKSVKHRGEQNRHSIDGKWTAHQKNLVMHYIRKCERIKENTQTKTTTSDSKNLQTLINNFSISSSENREQDDQMKTDTIIIDDMVLSEDECILNG
jgi:hypothetical protein